MAATKSSPAPTRVPKTYKLYLGGKFPRSESGRSIEITSPRGEHLANVARASRKDVREAVLAARKAVAGWSGATAYNRGQVLYRVAEVLDGRRAQLAEELVESGRTRRQAEAEVDAAVEAWIYYAGFADKYAQVLGAANPVAAPYFNFTLPEPTGVVAIVAPGAPGWTLRGLAATIAPAIVTGNACVVVAAEDEPRTAITLGEVLATSDVPGGVVNVLTGHQSELAPVLAAHMDVNAIDIVGVTGDEAAGELERAAVGNLKRVARRRELDRRSAGSLDAIERFVEHKTVWHPIGS